MTDEEFEELWAKTKAADARQMAEWNALSEDEKKRRFEGYDLAFLERISENPFSGELGEDGYNDDDDEGLTYRMFFE